MPITEEEDQSRVESIERWLVFNRDPSDEHWRNMDCLMARLKSMDDKDEKITDLEARIDSITEDYENRLDTLGDRLQADHERHVERIGEEFETHLSTLREKLTETQEQLAVRERELILTIAELDRRGAYLEQVALKQAKMLRGEVGVDRLRQKLAAIDVGGLDVPERLGIEIPTTDGLTTEAA